MRRRLAILAAAVSFCSGCSAAGDTTGKQAVGATPGSTSPASSSRSPTSSPTQSATEEAGKVLRTAISATRNTSAHFVQKLELGTTDKHFTLTMAGDFDFAGDRGNIAVDFPEGGISHTDEVFADGQVYVSNIPQLDGKWATMPRDAAEAHYLLRAPLNDPEHYLEQVTAIREAANVGREDVDGVTTTHYRGVLVGDAILLRMAEKVRTGMREIDSDLRVPTDVWVDSAGRVIRTRMTLRMAGGDVTTTSTLTQLGTPVQATAPALDQVVRVQSLTGVLNG
ncbi:LppX_LprAFG lipoprotein [Embleya sp. AB8]|uniref:LppX_LprAFG lipoprotein n=1 Tax=Embleya sp. AB8 TaxID=3156304 RepID=UPI003C78A736